VSAGHYTANRAIAALSIYLLAIIQKGVSVNRNVVSACLILISTCVVAQQPPAAASKETLRVPPYPSEIPWKEITNKKNEDMEMVEWIPADQDEKDIKDILTKQVFYSSKGQDPAPFVDAILKGVGRACERARVNGSKEQTENGFAVAYAQAYCTNQKGAAKDVDIFIKAIRGADALYVLQREFRRPATPGATPGVTSFSKEQFEEMKARMSAQSTALKFLGEQVQLCPPTGGVGLCAAEPTAATTPVTATPAPVTAPADATASATSFVEGKSTAAEIKAALGKPKHENHNPDGRFVYLYSTKDGAIIAYLFDKEGVLTRIRGYKTK
jgi:hypothetical protein